MTWSLSLGRVSTTLSSISWQKGQRMGCVVGALKRVADYCLPPMQNLCLTVNGKPQTAPTGTTVSGLLQLLGLDPQRVAVERNEDVVPRKSWSEAVVSEGDKIEIVAFIGGGSGAGSAGGSTAGDDDLLVLGGRTFRSRLLVGTGKYASIEETRAALDATGAEIITVALRRVDLTPGAPSVLDAIDR